MKRRKALVALALALAWLPAGCKPKSPEQNALPSATPPPVGTKLVVAYGSEKRTWLEEALKGFDAQAPKTASGKRISVESHAMGSGEAMQAILSGALHPHVFSPASRAYVSLLNRRWLSSGHKEELSPRGEAIVLSPMVIATWKPMAEALGWPKKRLGWRDFLRVGAKADGWGAYGHIEWGPFKLGHTHPEYSNSGLLSVLAEVYAGSKKERGLTMEDLESSNAQRFVENVETSIVHYGKSTGFFFEKMLERGPAYLSAAVLYENLVVESYGKTPAPQFPLVAIYPAEGTFWSDHPYAVLDAEWVGPDERDAAKQLLEYLKAQPRQERALALGFRPTDPSIPVAAPIDAPHGADPGEPRKLLEVPEAATLDALVELFKRLKKHASVVFVFDKSKSMEGPALAEAKTGARAFLERLDDLDDVTLVFFDHKVHPPIGPLDLQTHRQELIEQIDSAVASGGTSVYDATLRAREIISERTSSNRIKAVVVMTDGQDESSKSTLAEVETAVRIEDGRSTVRVFTIAYGDLAEESELAHIAQVGHGLTAKGDKFSIIEIYKDMATFF